MILIFGGAYQGKLDFAKKKLNVSEEGIYEEAISKKDISEEGIYKVGGTGKAEDVQDFFNKDTLCIYGLHNWVRKIVVEKKDPDAEVLDFIEEIKKREATSISKAAESGNKNQNENTNKNQNENRNENTNKNQKENQLLVIMDDISQGIVPLDPLDRAYREANGRAMVALSMEASEVYRIFCGIPSRIK